MPGRGKLFDSECLGLADHFLEDLPQFQGKRKGLAVAIQQAVEDWFAVTEAEFDKEVAADVAAADGNCPTCDGDGWVPASHYLEVGPQECPTCHGTKRRPSERGKEGAPTK